VNRPSRGLAVAFVLLIAGGNALRCAQERESERAAREADKMLLEKVLCEDNGVTTPGTPPVPDGLPGTVDPCEPEEESSGIPPEEDARQRDTRRQALRTAGKDPPWRLVRRASLPVLKKLKCRKPETIELDTSNLDPGRDPIQQFSLECDSDVVTWQRYASPAALRAEGEPAFNPELINGNVRVFVDDLGLPDISDVGELDGIAERVRRACECGKVRR